MISRPGRWPIGRRTLLAALLGSVSAQAFGRRAPGGVLKLVMPWSAVRLDPHELDDPLGALFGAALCDPLYAFDALGRAYPALARALPEATARGARVQLRSGLVTGRGKPILARHAARSLARALERGGRSLLSDFGPPELNAKDPLSLEFTRVDPRELALRLASPLTAIVPTPYSPVAPDGTGAFTVRFERGVMTLSRNVNAARGAAFLDAIEVRTVASLSEGLRAFEAGAADVGWLGSGLYRARPGALAFRGGAYGFTLLRTGKQAGRWGAPGVGQLLIDGIERERLQHLGLEELPEQAGKTLGWGGGPAEILVVDDSPHLVLLARVLGTALGRAGHELVVSERPRAELARRREKGDFALLVDFVRALGPRGPMTQRTLLAAENPELALKPPHLTAYEPRSIARGLSFGVVGELWSMGAHAADIQGLAGWQLGDVWRVPRAPST